MGMSSRTSECLIAISHIVAALNQTSFAGSKIIPRDSRQPGTACQCPQCNVRVEKEVHELFRVPVNNAAILVFARSMLSGIRNRPFASPIRFETSALRNAVKLTTAFPAGKSQPDPGFHPRGIQQSATSVSSRQKE